jgi:hypothetical protein
MAAQFLGQLGDNPVLDKRHEIVSMCVKNVKGIVPQLGQRFVKCVFTGVLSVGGMLGVVGCAHVQVPVDVPKAPNTLDEAKAYMSGREQRMQVLDYEINQQTIACYERFFVSSCLDDVRLQGARLRRAHLEALGQARNLIRLDEYAKRRSSGQPQPILPLK